MTSGWREITGCFMALGYYQTGRDANFGSFWQLTLLPKSSSQASTQGW
jgi:hypothetical protein